MLPPTLPDDARTWVFTADRALDRATAEALLADTERFLERWASHGRPVPGGATLLHDRFLVVAAHLTGGVSGCGIDSMVHAVERIGADHGVAWLDGLHVAYRDEDGVVRARPRADFRRLARDGAVTAATPVFVTTAETLGDLRAGGLERPAGTAWHGRVFRLAEPA